MGLTLYDHQTELWFNGGRGAAFSRGLLRAITAEQWVACEGPEGPAWGGDNRITECLRRHDIGPTMLSRSMQHCRCGAGLKKVANRDLTTASPSAPPPARHRPLSCAPGHFPEILRNEFRRGSSEFVSGPY